MEFYRKTLKPILTVVVIVFMAYTFYNGMKGYTYTIDDTKVTITRGSGIHIPLSEVSDVQFFSERLPTLSNRVGEAIGNKRNGTFTVAGVGRGKVYATDITKPGLIIFTKDTFYAITPENAQDFMARLQAARGK